MPSGADVALARVSESAYLNQPTGLPTGFYPVSQAALGITLGDQELYQNGVFVNRNGAAQVLVGTLNGVTTAVLAFRGSDDREDSINDLQNINREFELFGNLLASFDAFVARQGITQVTVTGHSLGGPMIEQRVVTGRHVRLTGRRRVSGDRREDHQSEDRRRPCGVSG